MEANQTNTAGAFNESIADVSNPFVGARNRTLEVIARRQWPRTSTGTIERLCFEDYQSCDYQDGMFWVYFGERRCRTFRQEDVLSFEAFPASEGRYRGLKAQEDEEAKNSAPFKEKGYVVLAQGGIQLPRPAIEAKVEELEKRVSDLEKGLRGEVSWEPGGDLKIERTGNTVTYRYAGNPVPPMRSELPSGKVASKECPILKVENIRYPLDRRDPMACLTILVRKGVDAPHGLIHNCTFPVLDQAGEIYSTVDDEGYVWEIHRRSVAMMKWSKTLINVDEAEIGIEEVSDGAE